MAVDPAGKFLYVSNSFESLGASYGPLGAYSIDAVSGALTAVPGSPFDVGGSQGSAAIDASGRFLIVETGAKAGCLAVLSIDPNTGALTSVPGSPFGQICGFVGADPSGPYFYVGESYGSSPGPGIYTLSLDQATGALTPIGSPVTFPFPGEIEVTSLALTH
jgi:6-phosphogluconolactonase